MVRWWRWQAEGVWTFVAYRKRDGKEMVLTKRKIPWWWNDEVGKAVKEKAF